MSGSTALSSAKKKARLILSKAVLRQYGIKGRMKKYSVEKITSFLLDIVSDEIEELSPAQEGMWRQIEADFDKWIREENARKEGRL